VIAARRGQVGLPARAVNGTVATVVGRAGVPVPGLYMLRVHGRRSGALHVTPVMVVREMGSRYLVAPRGETEWTRNLRAAGWGELMRGRRIDRVRAVEVEGRERQRALRAYLRRYGWLTRRLFDLPPGALRGEDLRRIAPQHAVFRLAPG